MKGPASLVRSGRIAGCSNIKPIYEWTEGKGYLTIDHVKFRGKEGAILCYYNPPVHQVGNPGLDGYLAGLEKVFKEKDRLGFLILYGANDPVHAGGDLKESLTRLEGTLELKKQREATGASEQEIDRLFEWADGRLEKGFSLYKRVRSIAQHLRVVAVCGGGTRFGGSAEVPLMADYLVGDSRSAMCFSEALIGLLPGWAGVGRALTKAGLGNTQYMAMTSKEANARQLEEIGIYNVVVDVPFGFPKRGRTEDPQADKAAYLEALESHDVETGLLLLPKGLEIATCDESDIPVRSRTEQGTLATTEQISEEVGRRKNPENYAGIWGKPLREVRDELTALGRPLAPQSVEALGELFATYDPSSFDEERFVKAERDADARLYRDPRFRAGLIATLEQTVADFRSPEA